VRKSTGLPAGRIVYSDTSSWGKVEDPIYDPFYDLAGKPDYVIHKNGSWIPVEVKSMRAPLLPYSSHVLQLAAYCLLIEQTKNIRPSHGILHYRDRTFAIEYNDDLKKKLIDKLVQMRKYDQKREGPPRSHELPTRCRSCGYRSHCDDAI
jgi:CRISPR-associated exonuclease Cas4